MFFNSFKLLINCKSLNGGSKKKILYLFFQFLIFSILFLIISACLPINNLKELKNQKIYDKNHLIIIHREKNSKDDFEGILKILNEKVYGRSKIIFALFE